jgi:hypothetical protein
MRPSRVNPEVESGLFRLSGWQHRNAAANLEIIMRVAAIDHSDDSCYQLGIT